MLNTPDSNPLEGLIKLLQGSLDGKCPVLLILPNGKEIHTLLPDAEARAFSKRIVASSPPCPCGCGSYDMN